MDEKKEDEFSRFETYHGPKLVYNEILLDHFTNPRNTGEIKDASGVAMVGDPMCGDSVKLFIKVENDILKKVTYQVFGCGAAIATSSILSELATGKTIDEALVITDDDVIEAAKGIPERKAHCSLLAVQALHEAIGDYLIKKSQEDNELFKFRTNSIDESERNGK
ncbi:MAG: iron-sulfur cluster assembly scaffold protein [Spirochaetes bacterium]|nr:MAG: iron-sulfur cluster assembly scaffold protein [Spirochaetota bacterium]